MFFKWRREQTHLECENSSPRTNVWPNVCFVLFLLLSLAVRFQESTFQLCFFLSDSICPIPLGGSHIPMIFLHYSRESRTSASSEGTSARQNEASYFMSWVCRSVFWGLWLRFLLYDFSCRKFCVCVCEGGGSALCTLKMLSVKSCKLILKVGKSIRAGFNFFLLFPEAQDFYQFAQKIMHAGVSSWAR